MSIELQTDTITIGGGLLSPSGHGDIIGLSTDPGGTKIIVVLRDSTSPNNYQWTEVDISNPLIPTASAWVPASTAWPSYFGDALTHPNANTQVNCMWRDPASNFAYLAFVDPTGGTNRLKVTQIDTSSGAVTFLNAILYMSDGSNVV